MDTSDNWFDLNGALRLDEIVAAQPSFQKIMRDGQVSAQEYREQTALVTELLRTLDGALAPEQKAQVTQVLSELAVLMALPHQAPRAPGKE